MKPPKKLTLAGDKVSVKQTNWLGRFNMCSAVGEGGGYGVSGYYRNNKIEYVDHLVPYYEKDVILHEVLHKVWERAGLGQRYAASTEEFIVSGIASWLLLLLRENPELVDYLMEEA